jgi:hypothetical protein
VNSGTGDGNHALVLNITKDQPRPLLSRGAATAPSRWRLRSRQYACAPKPPTSGERRCDDYGQGIRPALADGSGKDNYAADCATVDAVLKVAPEMGFAGIATAGNTHQVAQAMAPESRVVYADYDSPVLAIRVRTRRLQSACLVMIVSRVPAADPPAIAPAGARSMNEHGARTPRTRLLIQVQSRSRGSNSIQHIRAMSNK